MTQRKCIEVIKLFEKLNENGQDAALTVLEALAFAQNVFNKTNIINVTETKIHKEIHKG